MAIVEGFYDEIGFSESMCSGFDWSNTSLEVSFQQGIDLGPNHPLANAFRFSSPCCLLFEGVIKSKLRISHWISAPNNFKHHYFEKLDLPEPEEGVEYTEFYLEGVMPANNPTGWFVWDIVALRVKLDDLK